jgi:YD repeat-containing protein
VAFVSSTDANGNVTSYKYDAYGDLTDVYLPAVLDPSHPSSPAVSPHYQYTYDSFGNMIAETDPNGNATLYGYNALGQKVSETLPNTPTTGTPTETWTYNSLGQLSSTTDFDGNVANFTYDSQGRVFTKTEYSANATSPSIAVTYTYDNIDTLSGRRYDTVTVSNVASSAASGTTTTYYDAEGNVVAINSTIGGVTATEGDISYAYNTLNQKTDVTTANTHIHYDYDAQGRLSAVTALTLNGAAADLVTQYTYYTDNSLHQTFFPNGTIETRTYD